MPSDEWIRQQFTFEDDAELKWQINVENRNVECRGVSDRIDARAFGVPGRSPCARYRDLHRRQNRLHDEPRPEAGRVYAECVRCDRRTSRSEKSCRGRWCRAQISGARMKYERSRLSQPWRLWTAANSPDHAGTAVPAASAERSSARSFSGSAVVAILVHSCNSLQSSFTRARRFPRSVSPQSLDANAEHSHRLSNDVNRTSNHDQTTWSGNLASPLQGLTLHPLPLRCRCPSATRAAACRISSGRRRARVIGVGHDHVIRDRKQNLGNFRASPCRALRQTPW